MGQLLEIPWVRVTKPEWMINGFRSTSTITRTSFISTSSTSSKSKERIWSIIKVAVKSWITNWVTKTYKCLVMLIYRVKNPNTSTQIVLAKEKQNLRGEHRYNQRRHCRLSRTRRIKNRMQSTQWGLSYLTTPSISWKSELWEERTNSSSTLVNRLTRTKWSKGLKKKKDRSDLEPSWPLIRRKH